MCKNSLETEQNRREDKYDSVARVYCVCHIIRQHKSILGNDLLLQQLVRILARKFWS